MKSKIVNIPLEKRNCDVCNSKKLESLYKYDKYVCNSESANLYLFKVDNVICCNCGFTFVSPCFDSNILIDYYSKSLRTPLDQTQDYDINFRMEIINKFTKPNPSKGKPKFIELGPSTFGEFQNRISESFDYFPIEPSIAFRSLGRKVVDIGEIKLADIIAHYFCLEHIPRPLEFLEKCNSLLRIGGIMIIEVPNIEIYPTDPHSLNLYEHQSHFSFGTLKHLANKAGFEHIESNKKSSRSFGMLLVFKKIHELPIPSSYNFKEIPNEYEINKINFNLGLDQIKIFNNNLIQAKSFIDKSEDSLVILWGANQNLIDFIQMFYLNLKIPDFLILIDSDRRKRNFLLNYDTHFAKEVLIPSECIDLINKASKLIIFSRRHEKAILDQINCLRSKNKSLDVLIVDINP